LFGLGEPEKFLFVFLPYSAFLSHANLVLTKFVVAKTGMEMYDEMMAGDPSALIALECEKKPSVPKNAQKYFFLFYFFYGHRREEGGGRREEEGGGGRRREEMMAGDPSALIALECEKKPSVPKMRQKYYLFSGQEGGGGRRRT
jgi:hypothetical protein